jgi:hypothetical protein
LKPLPHSIVALVASIPVPLVLGVPVPSWGMFVAASVAPLLDLDRTERPPYTTPFGHSLLMAVLWTAIGLSAILGLGAVLHNSRTLMIDMAGGLVVGLWSHIMTDVLLGEVVYTIPRTASYKRLFSQEPFGPDFIGTAGHGLAVVAGWAVLNRLANGELAWPYWGRTEFSRARNCTELPNTALADAMDFGGQGQRDNEQDSQWGQQCRQ